MLSLLLRSADLGQAPAFIGFDTQRIIHDVPPVWDGKDPDNQAEAYLKSLAGWLATTRSMKQQQGMTIMHYAAGDLKTICNELDVEQLTCDSKLPPEKVTNFRGLAARANYLAADRPDCRSSGACQKCRP